MKESNKISVVVLGMGPTGLSLARAFGKASVPVYGIGLNKNELGFYSKYVTRLGDADPRFNRDKLIQLLGEFRNTNQLDKIILYPSGDEYVEFLNKNNDVLKDVFLYNPVRDIDIDTFLDKKNFYYFCKKNNIPTIESFFPSNYDDAILMAEKVPYPCFIKPIYLHKWAPIHGFIKGFQCDNASEYIKYIKALSMELNNIMVQEVVVGDDNQLPTCLCYTTTKGETRDFFTARKIRQYPTGFGTATAVEKTNEKELIEYSKKILNKSGYRGFSEVEAKWCSKDSIYKVIEVNIRPCRLNGFAEGLGVNMYYNSLLDIIGEDYVESSQILSNNYRWLFLYRDIISVMSRLFKRSLSFNDLVYSYKGKRVHCIWDKHDMKPAIMYSKELFAKGIKMIFK